MLSIASSRLTPFFFALTACYGVHNSEPLETPTGLAWSCDVLNGISAEYYAGLKFTFENKTSDWQEIEVSSAEILPTDPSVKILSPAEIEEFWQSYRLRYSEIFNQQQIVKGLVGSFFRGMGAGAASAAMSHHGGGYHRSTDVAIAVAASSSSSSPPSTESVTFSDDHILGQKFRVAPGLYLRKWMLIEVRDRTKLGMLKICFSKPTKQCATYSLETNDTRTNATKMSCDPSDEIKH